MADRLNELLAELQKASGCPYLSDLHNDHMSQQEKATIMAIAEDKYTLDTWNRAAAYIAGHPCKCSKIQDAKVIITDR